MKKMLFMSNFFCVQLGLEQSGVFCQNYLKGNRQPVDCYGLGSIVKKCDMWVTVIGWNDSHIIKQIISVENRISCDYTVHSAGRSVMNTTGNLIFCEEFFEIVIGWVRSNANSS